MKTKELLMKILKNTLEILELLRINPKESVDVDDLLKEYLLGKEDKYE